LLTMRYDEGTLDLSIPDRMLLAAVRLLTKDAVAVNLRSG